MSDCSQHSNPLVRNGTGRHERFRKELDKNFVLPDERRMEDWIVYARNLAGRVQYYNTNKQAEGNWQPFFDADISSQLALMAVQDITDYKDRIRTLFTAIQDKETPLDEARSHFGQLFGALFSLAKSMDHFMDVLPADLPMLRVLQSITISKLAPGLKRLMGYYTAGKAYQTAAGEDFLTETEDLKWSLLGYPQKKADAIMLEGLSAKWWLGAPSWADYVTALPLDKTIYNHPDPVIADIHIWKVLNHAVSHNLLSTVFAEFLAAYARIVQEARQQLETTVSRQDTHEPHYALYLAFLHLFKHAQTEINTYTGQHLDFYYKQILRLAPKKSQPNHVHLAMELANAVPRFLLSKGTAFKAGKDGLGKEVLYRVDEDTVLNKAVVSNLRSFYRTGPEDGSLLQGLYASPVANSADGLGAKINNGYNDWAPFANKQFTDGVLTGIQMPKTQVGFAFASHYLFLSEGRRTITLTLQGNDLTALQGKTFDCWLSTEKGWLQKPALVLPDAGLEISVSADDPPITAYVPKVHGEGFAGADTPVAKFLLQNPVGTDAYDTLKNISITSASLRVQVGTLGTFNTDGIRQLTVNTDMGTADPAKPFIPFGTNPKKGAGVIIGNGELFAKAGAQFKLFVEWAELKKASGNDTSSQFPSALLLFLQNGVWVEAEVAEQAQSPVVIPAVTPVTPSTITTLNVPSAITIDFASQFRIRNLLSVFPILDASEVNPKTSIPSDKLPIPPLATRDYHLPYDNYGIVSRNGYMKLQLNEDFEWDQYYQNLQTYYIKLANNPSDNTLTIPPKPYLPKIQAMYLSYEATDVLTFGNQPLPGTSKFFHLYPFGTHETDRKEQKWLMPQFAHKEGSEQAHHCAEFYIGLDHAEPLQKINILFQVLDGSTDPRQSKPEKHVYWSYLSNNQWTDFKITEINDTTRQLLETGIITFSLPADANREHTLLPGGKHWLRAAIQTLPEQVCHLVDVRAQVVQATFYDQGNAPDFSQKPLPPGSIAKPLVPEPAIKKTEQPYASFGGRYAETDTRFYTRVSERLRHKNRAITLRDVEQMVLEQFTDIHQAKCLNHTRLEPGPPLVYNELAPGHVTVITIPDLKSRNAINPLRPYTAKSKLQEIKQFLEAHASVHMTWHVENPSFEEIRVKTDIRLTDDAAGNDTFYRERLSNDLVQFLTPWAQAEPTDIRFGGKMTESTLINFMEELPYVDVILSLEMFHRKEGQPEIKCKDEVSASTARSILVSAAAAKHEITIVPKPA